MQENRQTIRRNLTGGLSLGLFAGIALAIPEVVKVLISGEGTHYIPGVAAFHIAFGLLGGGVSGLIVGSWAATVDRFKNGEQHRVALWSWLTKAVIGIFLLYPLAKISMELPQKVAGVVGAILFLHLIAPLVVKRYTRIFAGYTSHFHNGLIALLLATGGFVASWTGMRFLRRPLYWELLSLTLFLSAGLIVFLSMRHARRTRRGHLKSRGRGVALLATPKPIVGLLIAAMALGAFARYSMNPSSSTQLEASAPVAVALTVGSGALPEAPPSQAHAAAPTYTGDKFRVPQRGSVLIVTHMGGDVVPLDGAFVAKSVILPHGHPSIILSSLFTGLHYGLRLYLAPHLPAAAASIPGTLENKRGYRLVNLSGIYDTPAFLRELPNMGFPSPVPFLRTTADKLAQVQASLEDFKSPFLAWVHVEGALTKPQLQSLISSGPKKNLWLVYLRWPQASGEGIPSGELQVLGKGVPQDSYNAPIPLPAILPSLFGLGRRGYDLGGRSMPPSSRELAWVQGSKAGYLKNGSTQQGIPRGLKKKIERSLRGKRAPHAWLAPSRPVQEQILILDQLLCRGWLSLREKRRFAKYSPKLVIHPQVDKRAALLRRLLSGTPLPAWSDEVLLNQVLSGVRRTTRNLVTHELVRFVDFEADWDAGRGSALIDEDPGVTGWVFYLKGGGVLSSELMLRCPGVTFLPRPRKSADKKASTGSE